MKSRLLEGRNNAKAAFTDSPVKNICKPCEELGSLEIVVIEKKSKESVANVLVKISGPQSQGGKTDVNGRIVFSSLPTGSYSVELQEEEIDIEPNHGSDLVSPQQTTKKTMEVKRKLRTVRVKRKNISLKGDDKYGHWWVEIASVEGQVISEQESYGWWPAGGVGTWETLTGTKGVLNGMGYFDGSSTQDPHHGDVAEEDFNPYIHSGASAVKIKECMRSFAKNYSGTWRWTFGAGQNCHTFQEDMLEHCKLDKE